MTLVPMSLPPGVYANGTESQSRGRYRDCNLVRWFEGTLRPMAGWVKKSASAVSGKGRALLAWVDGDAVRWCAVGTHSKLYIMARTGAVYDITPTGLSVGLPIATIGGGYGSSMYGKGKYSAAGTDPGLITEATVWSLDNFGQYLVATNAKDGKVYKWTLNTGTPAAAISGAPINNRSLVVTEEGFLFVLGAAGNPRLVQWADQQSDSTWTPDATNQAGNFPLQTGGRLMCGKRVTGGTLLFTDQDVYRAEYQGPPLVYGFTRVGTGCGVISQGAVVVGGDAAVVWMSKSGFWTYDGFAKPLPCEVSDKVFGNLNPTQVSLISSFYSTAYGEMTWLYPSTGSSENDSYVRYNHREGHWAVGKLNRLSGHQEGVFSSPLMVGTDGYVYSHESGWAYDGAHPYAETGPVEVGNGDRVFTATALIPDERILGSVQATFYGRYQPTDTERTYGPYTARSKTDVRFSARQARMRLTGQANADWRVGAFALDLTLGGSR